MQAGRESSNVSSMSEAVAPSIRKEAMRLVGPLFYLALAATLVGIVSGIATTWLIATINDALHPSGPLGLRFFLGFCALCLFSILGSAAAGITNSVVGQRVIAVLRREISRRLTQAPLETIERLQPHKVLAILANDIESVSIFTFNLSGYAAALAIVLACVGYVASLSVAAFFIFLGAITIAAVLTGYSRLGWAKDYSGVRDAQDRLQQQYRAITEGAKELRLNDSRAAQVHDKHLAEAVQTISDRKIAAMRRFWLISSVTSGIMFVAIGLLLLTHDGLSLSDRAVSGAVLAILYIRTPMEQILNGLPAFFQAQVALRRITTLSAGLADRPLTQPKERRHFAGPDNAIEISGGIYEFKGPDGSAGFRLGPVDLKVNAGETLFIVGENGSGKTTLVKLLLGLYPLHAGVLKYGGSFVPAEDLPAYRQIFSAIFADYFLFSDLVSLDEKLVAKAQIHLQQLEIAHKVDIRDGAFSTIDLSTGQRKRLALIHAYLEQRPVIMFDEWAADQDPTFRRIFYEEILTDLKAQGRTLIVVSHDDRFFHFADRIVTLHNGLIISTCDSVKAVAQTADGVVPSSVHTAH